DRSWPSFGVSSTPPMDGDGTTPALDNDSLVDGGDSEQENNGLGPIEAYPIEAASSSDADTASTDESDEAESTTDYAYSGDLEAPAFEWPAAPGSDEGHTEDSGTDEVDQLDAIETEVTTTAAITTTIAMGDTTPLPDAESEDGEPAEQVAAATTDPAIDVDQVDTAVTSHGQDLPSPFSSANGSSAVDYADAPLAPIIDLRNVADSGGPDIDEAIDAGEVEVVAALIEQGMLSTDGPISDRDVRTMVYVAFTSNELRKLLAAGGSPDGPNPGIDLGPVELFKDGLVQPPKTLYPGPPVQTEARSQLG
ncbi:MAG: hypothetical protein AAFO29_19055, partial [Actinomycetota bacterium]